MTVFRVMKLKKIPELQEGGKYSTDDFQLVSRAKSNYKH